MLEELNRLAKNQKLIVECSDGEEFTVEKVYSVSGRASAIKILIGGEVKIDELKEELENYQEELKSAERALDSAEEDLRDAEEKHEEYLQKIDSALESAEFKLGIETSSRHSYDRISELALKINQMFESFEEEREFLKGKILELENWKENTLKDKE